MGVGGFNSCLEILRKVIHFKDCRCPLLPCLPSEIWWWWISYYQFSFDFAISLLWHSLLQSEEWELLKDWVRVWSSRSCHSSSSQIERERVVEQSLCPHHLLSLQSTFIFRQSTNPAFNLAEFKTLCTMTCLKFGSLFIFEHILAKGYLTKKHQLFLSVFLVDVMQCRTKYTQNLFQSGIFHIFYYKEQRLCSNSYL